MKGIAEAEKRAIKNPRVKNEERTIEVDQTEMLSAPPLEEEKEKPTGPLVTEKGVIGHSNRQKASWLDGLTEKFTNWLEDE
jgi:hypothetical protein